MGSNMRGLTHVFFGIGFVSLLLGIFKTPIILWGIGTFLIAPIFSRLPDQDQKIARITFNQIVPHRGKGTHNLLYGIPLFLLIVIQGIPIVGSLLITLVGSIFGAIFIHSFVDAFNHSGVWIGIFRVKGFLDWDSFWGNLSFKILGILLFFLSLLCYMEL
ncbi:MAG: metal-dependent hydrolase [Candidatus Heimdallarchaeota archaeon]|nr:MAG: metal-dependent hydrolase [Candidatus Heimdallarchaeota archaeon]